MFAISGTLDYANKAAAVANFMTFWTDKVPQGVWITIALIIPVLFNLLNVRRVGGIEYWLTMSKITLIVVLIVTGSLLAAGASPGPYLLGTDSNFQPVDCTLHDPSMGQCLPTPGFNCIPQLQAIINPYVDWRQDAW